MSILIRTDDTLTGILDRYTHEECSYSLVTGVTDNDVDGIYITKPSSGDQYNTATVINGSINIQTFNFPGNEYFKRNGRLYPKNFGAVVNGSTDDSASIAIYANYCRKAGQVLYFPSGNYKFTVDRTGLNVDGDGETTRIYGLPGCDVFGHKKEGETGYSTPNGLFSRNVQVFINASLDNRNNFFRIDFAGRRIGNCAFYLPNAITHNFDIYFITTYDTTLSGNLGAGTCGVFFAGSAYKINWGRKWECRQTSFGVIGGLDDGIAEIKPYSISSFTTSTFTVNHQQTNGNQVALVWDTNKGNLNELSPRKGYYVVNATLTSFQIANTIGGSPISVTTSGSPQLYVIPAGSSSIEFACDEWASLQMINVTHECGFSVTNMYKCHFANFGIQSNYVSFNLLSYQSLDRLKSSSLTFKEIYSELSDLSVQNIQFINIEADNIHIGMGGMLCSTGYNTNSGIYATLNSSSSIYEYILLDNGSKLYVQGDSNKMTVSAPLREQNIVNNGVSNEIVFTSAGNGSDGLKKTNFLHRQVINKEIGGFWPDYLSKGLTNNPYQSENVLFYEATAQYYAQQQSSGNLDFRFDDDTCPTSGYVRVLAGGSLGSDRALNTNYYYSKIGIFFPKGKMRIYARVKAVSGSASINLIFTKYYIPGTVNITSTNIVETTWTDVYVDVDTSDTLGEGKAATSFYSSSPYDVAFWYYVPFAMETFTNQINFGDNHIKTFGTGSPEGNVLANMGSEYTDINTGDVYRKLSGGAYLTGWTMINIFTAAEKTKLAGL